jgi:hypothetical protein
MIFGSLPGVFWGFAVAFLVILILGVRSSLNKNQISNASDEDESQANR